MSKQNRKSNETPVTDSVPVDLPVGAETTEAVQAAAADETPDAPDDNAVEPPAHNAVVARIMQARRADDPKGSLVLVVSPENAGMLSEFIANSQSISGSTMQTPRQARRRPRQSREQRIRAVRRPSRPAVAADGPRKARGRVAGRYIMGSKEPTYLTDSIGGVYKYIQKHKKGATAKEVADSLKMPMGTVGWALQVLKKTGAIDTAAA